MNYINTNKQAWEEAFSVNQKNFGEDNADKLKNKQFPFLQKDFIEAINKFDLSGKRLAQFCCNNGRELMSVVKGTNAKSGTGFDIAENIIQQAKNNAALTGINCDFVACNVLEVDEKYHGQFDAAFITAGALCWFENLDELFLKVSQCLVSGGLIFINEIHPCTNMLAVSGEDGFDEANPTKIAWTYFKDEPFIDNNGMPYLVGEQYKSKTFTCFSHKFSDIINALANCNAKILKLSEFDYDVSGDFKPLNGKGYPLSYVLTAKKD